MTHEKLWARSLRGEPLTAGAVAMDLPFESEVRSVAGDGPGGASACRAAVVFGAGASERLFDTGLNIALGLAADGS